MVLDTAIEGVEGLDYLEVCLLGCEEPGRSDHGFSGGSSWKVEQIHWNLLRSAGKQRGRHFNEKCCSKMWQSETWLEI